MRRRTASFGLVCLFLAGSGYAQTTTGNIVGTVTDNTGSVLTGVKVSLKGEAIVGTQTALTNERGSYRFVVLPPGTYELNFSVAGFAELNRTGLKVLVGQTHEENASLKLPQMTEEVTVMGEAPVIDPQSTQVSTNYDRDWVRNSPMNRNSFVDLINSAPGVGSSGPTSAKTYNSTSFGSSTTENTYMMDGTDLTAPYSGEVWPLPNTDAIEEIQVLSLGAPAEYGNLQGAVFNVVTRQGSNAFHGDANFYVQHDALTSRNTSPTEDGGLPYHRTKYNDVTLQLSGPVVKDKLWFFLAYEYKTDQDSQPGTDPAFPIVDARQSGIAKLNYQISPNHKVMLAFHEDYYHLPGLVTANSPPSATTVDHGTSPAPNVTYNAILSDKTYFEARYAGFYGSDHGDPIDGSQRTARRFLDLGTGATSGGIFIWYDGAVPRTGFNAKLSHFADSFLGGSHDLKFGVQYAKGGADYTNGTNDYIYTGGAYLYGFHQDPYHNAGETKTIGTYVDDSFHLGQRLTLNLGLRYDHSRASFVPRPVLDANGNPTGQVSKAVDSLFTWNVVSPRVGFVLKLTASGKTLLKGHYGRYYRGMITSEFDPASPSIPPKFLFSGTYDAQGNPLGETVFSDNSHLKIDPQMKDPHTDQYIGSLEHQVAPNLAVSLTYIHKEGRDYAGWSDIAGQYVPVPFVDNLGTDPSGQTIIVQKLVSDPSQRVFELTNPPRLFTKYDGGTFAITKRMSNHWQLTSSLVLSKSQGRIASSIYAASSDQSSTASVFNGSFFGLNPNDFVNTEGLLIGDRPVVFKTQFLYELPAGFLMSINYAYETGRPWARRQNVSSVVNIPSTNINAEVLDGHRRLPNLNLLDLRLQKAFPLRRGARFDLFADALNLLNVDESEGILSHVGTQSTFAQPSNFVLPRRVMLGAKFEF
jgi:hypothetical protein